MPQPALRSARRLLLACAPLACVLLAWVLTAPLSAAHAQAPGAPPPAVTVSAPVTRQTTDYLEYTGQFAAVDYVEIRSRVSGFLAERHFTDGQIVTKGDLLAVIDPRPFEIELQGAEAQRDTAAAQLDFAQRDVARGAALRQTEALATSTFDQRVQQMKTAGAALSAANAAIRNAKLDLEYSRVTAPISGRIGALQVSAGNLIVGGKDSNNSTLLATIVSVDPLWFNFDMSESDFLAYSRAVSQGRLGSPRDGGTAAQLRLDDERDWTRAATINFIDNQIDRASGTIRVRATVPNPGLFITPGQFARIRLPSSEPHTALLVPDAAVTTDQSRKVVMTVDATGTVVPKIVTTGPIVGGLREIRTGLAPSDQVVIDGLLRARPGTKVTPQPGSITAQS